MEWLVIFRFLPILVELAEGLFVGKKTGKEKKDFVLKAIPEVVKGMEEVSTGGQKETWKAVNDNITTVSKSVDVMADVLFPGDTPPDMM